MAIVTSKEFVAAAQEVQREAVEKLRERGVEPRIAIVRMTDPDRPGYYSPTASYAKQIRNHAAAIGVDSSEDVLWPDRADRVAEVIRELGQDPKVTGIMPLYNFSHDRKIHNLRAEQVKAALSTHPDKDIDDLLGRGNRAPTARAMIAMGNICTGQLVDPNGQPFFVGRTLDEASQLQLPLETDGGEFTADAIRIGGRGVLTGAPLLKILGAQGIEVGDSQVATAENPGALQDLPQSALVFTATPKAEQIRNEDIPGGSVIIDAGFGVVDGVTYGNASREVATRSDVLWTPPREGVGPVSTVYLFHHLIEAAGYPIEDLPPLGGVALGETVDYIGV